MAGGTRQEAYRREWGKRVRCSWRSRILRSHGERDATWTSSGDERGSRIVYNTSDVLIRGRFRAYSGSGRCCGSGVFDREVLWKGFDGKAGEVVGHSIEGWGEASRVFICDRGDAD